MKTIGKILAVFIGLIIISSVINGEESTPSYSGSSSNNTPKTETSSEPSVPRQHRNALGKAEDYLKIGHWSYQDLVYQLEYHEFPSDAVEYAMANIEVDWNEQALGKAEDYLKVGNMSDNDLRNQLDYHGFTKAQIEYAMANLED